MTYTTTETVRQSVVYTAPLARELARMEKGAEQAFYQEGSSEEYVCHEIQQDLAPLFGVDSSTEYRYYLWQKREPDVRTGLPFAAIYAVNVYGCICGKKCFFEDGAIQSLARTFLAQAPVLSQFCGENLKNAQRNI